MLAATTSISLLTFAFPAQAIVGTPVADKSYGFAAKIEIGEGDLDRSCTGALVDVRWILTAAACFTNGTSELKSGKPGVKTTAIVGRTDLQGSGGQSREVVNLVPHGSRGLVLARLNTPVTGISPVALAKQAAAAGNVLTSVGYGPARSVTRQGQP
ncbi:trypsin-like serine protease, partial [Streptomyces halstedii]|uniref:trypsin-like serine protease n=1 Tax=Streptomyces halstedii TaxID=1944 RepID=UPI0033A8A27B